MKEQIMNVFERFEHDYTITEDNLYYYFTLSKGMIVSIVLKDLCDLDVDFIIDLYDCKNDRLTIAFRK